MKLSTAATIKYSGSEEFESIPILEDEASPRWSFKYDNFDHDPTPDVLVLGMYRHPNTGNNLVGAINLRYLDKNQISRLQRILPQLHKAKNLKRRYYMGISLLPDVFENYYRTYNAAYIRDLKRGAIYPKYGVLKTAANYVKRKASDLLKSKEQKQQDAMPQYPSDITDIDNRIDQAVRGVAQADPQEVNPQDVAAAQDDVRRQQQEPERSLAQQTREGQRAIQAAQAAKQQQQQVDKGQLPSGRDQAQAGYRADQIQATNDVREIEQAEQTQPEREEQIQPDVQQADQKTQPIEVDEVSDSEDIEPKMESIRYWSPALGKYITEVIYI